MRTKVAIASFLVILMAGVSASSTFHNFPDAVNQKQSHTQNVDFNWDWSSIISGSEDIVSDDIGIDIQGNSYIVGTINGVPDSKEFTINSNGGKDVFVAKFDAQGNQVWIENAGGAGDDYGLGIVVDEDANGDTVIFITGYLQMRETTTNGALVVNEAHFGDQLSYTASSGETSPFVAKISPWTTVIKEDP